MEIEPMRWQNPVSRAAAAAIHAYPRAAAAAAIHVYPKAAVAAAAAAIALKSIQNTLLTKTNETHYENITH
jgi:hypothetical protein